MIVNQPFSRADLELRGFRGFLAFATLRKIGLSAIPSQSGCYAVLHQSEQPPSFLERNPAGRFKGRDPTIGTAELRAAWVDESETIYIGQSSNLRTRWTTRLRFGGGEAVGAWGGRAMWQLEDSFNLVLAWKVSDNPKADEARCLREFLATYGRRPFANLR